jgi:hypothetical protein
MGPISKKISQKYGINLSIHVCDPSESPDLMKKESWDIIVMHLGNCGFETYLKADCFREQYKALVVAESSSCEVGLGGEEVKEHFDDFIGPIYKSSGWYLEALLERKILPWTKNYRED